MPAWGAAFVLALLVTACAPRATPPLPGASSTVPLEGGVLRMVQEQPASLDPPHALSVYESFPVNQIFDGLVGVDPGLSVVPALASRWTISRDGRTYIFHLRDGVRFHDGSLLTSEDVVYTFRRLLTPHLHLHPSVAVPFLEVMTGARAFMEGRRTDLPGITAVDPHTVRITLDRPYLSFLQVLALDGLRVVPRHAVEDMGDEAFGRTPVGTGPFRLQRWTADGLRLVANPDYFAGPPHLAAVEIAFFAAGSKDVGAGRFRAGELDALEVPSSDELDRLSPDPSVRIHRYQELNINFLGLCVSRPPLDDVRIRRAIAHAIHSQTIIEDSPLTRRSATGILPPGLLGYSPQPKALPYDPDRSRALLVEAGHPQGRGLAPIDYFTTSRSAISARVQDRIRTDLAAVGIQVRIREVSWSELNRRIELKTAPMFRLGWVADITDPDSFLRSLFEAGGTANYSQFRDPETERLLHEGAREMNPVIRARIYRTIEQRVLDLAPVVPLYHSVGVFATRKRVRDLEPGPMGIAGLNLEKAWLDGVPR